MAQRRLFSPDIVSSDAFLDMPVSTQALYFHLGMNADDDGFVNPKRIMRVVGASDDDLKVLLTKRFVLAFESGVVVIKHWLIHNSIRWDRYNPTRYLEEKKTLFIKANKAYTDVRQSGNQLATKRQPNDIPKLSKVKLSKDKIITAEQVVEEEKIPINKFIDLFKPLNQTYSYLFKRKDARLSSERLLKLKSLEEWQKVIDFVVKFRVNKFCPRITTPTQLEQKYPELELFANSVKQDIKNKNESVAFK